MAPSIHICVQDFGHDKIKEIYKLENVISISVDTLNRIIYIHFLNI